MHSISPPSRTIPVDWSDWHVGCRAGGVGAATRVVVVAAVVVVVAKEFAAIGKWVIEVGIPASALGAVKAGRAVRNGSGIRWCGWFCWSG